MQAFSEIPGWWQSNAEPSFKNLGRLTQTCRDPLRCTATISIGAERRTNTSDGLQKSTQMKHFTAAQDK